MTSHEQSSREEAPLVDGRGEEPAYQSDSDGGTSALALRRRVASDVEEEDQGLNSEKEPAYSDVDDDAYEDPGGPPDRDQEQEHEDEEEEEDQPLEEYGDAEEADALPLTRADVSKDDSGGGEPLKCHEQDGEGSVGVIETSGGTKEGDDEDKKTAEPFVVPTAGSFYMHDDRFEFNGVARPRRNAGGRKLWEAKDETRWVHDRFEELQLSEDSYRGQGGRGRGGRGRGRGQGRSQDARLMRGHDTKLGEGRESKDHVGDDAVTLRTRRVRGRGRALRRARMDDYEFKEIKPTNKRGEVRASIPKATARESPGKPEEAGSKKPASASSLLNSESPPFFPTGAITQNIAGGRPAAGTNKGPEDKLFDRTAAQVGRQLSSSRSGMDKRMPRASPPSLTRASSSPASIVSLVRDSGAVGEHEAARQKDLPQKSSATQQQQLVTAGSASLLPQQHEGGTLRMVEQLSYSASPQQHSRGNSLSQPVQMQQVQQWAQTIPQGQLPKGQPMQSQSLVSPIIPSAQPGVEAKAAPQALGNKLETSTSQRATQTTAVQAGRGSYMYGGGSMTNGLRSVGVAIPGYSSQPQFGFPNSEVTWIPILAGGGSLGSNYSSSYLAVDNSSPAVYYAPQATRTQQAAQTPAFPLSGRETSALQGGTSSSVMPPARPEADEFGQQRRRYSQMTFREDRG